MRKGFLVLVALIILVASMGGSRVVVITKAQAGETGAGDYRDLNLIVTVQGQVRVKREGWDRYALASFGTTLRRGDLLRLDEASHAKLVCADLTEHEAVIGIQGIPCTVTNPILTYGSSAVVPTRSSRYGSFPIVVSPRKTNLLNPRPKLRWTPVSGATAYKVTVRGPDLNWTTDVGSITELIYPESAPALKSKTDYKLIVTANGRQSDEESEAGLGFTVLRSNEAKKVRKQEQMIRELRLADAPQRLLIAYLYASHRLYAEAIEQLEELSKTIEEPALARLLGDLYMGIRLIRHSERSYLLGLERSEKANDQEGQALAHHALSKIYEALSNRGSMIRHLNSALELYNKLGDRQTTAQIKELLAGRKQQ